MSQTFLYNQSLYGNTELFYLFSEALLARGLQYKDTAESNRTRISLSVQITD